MIPFAAIPWGLVLRGAAVLVVAWLAFKLFAWVGDTIERAGKYETAVAAQREAEDMHSAYVAEAARKALAAAQLAEADMLADVKLAARAEALDAENAKLRSAARTIKPTMEKANAEGVRIAVINPDWWLCQSATLSGDAADAAACAARAGDAGLRN